MESGTKQGDEDGMGGVVTPSHLTTGVLVPSAFRTVSTWLTLHCDGLTTHPVYPTAERDSM